MSYSAGTLVISGWVWLLVIAAIFCGLAWRMVKIVGFKNLLVASDQDVNEFCRSLVFLFLIGAAGTCILVTIETWVQ